MKKLYSIFLVLIILILIGAVIITNYEKPKPSYQKNSSNISHEEVVYEPATEEDFKRFEEIAPENEIIQKLPENTEILLKFYNFNSGEREWDNSYLITRGKIEKSSYENVDMILIMSSMYLSKFNENNFCFIVKDAKRRGDFRSEIKISKTRLLWKYRSIMGYKDCLGI